MKQLISPDYDFSDMMLQEGMYQRSAKLYSLRTLSYTQKFISKCVQAAEICIKDLKRIFSTNAVSHKKIFSDSAVVITVLLFTASIPLVFVWVFLLLS